MNPLGDLIPDSTSSLGNIKSEQKYEEIQISSDDEADSTEVINLSSDDETENTHEIIEISSEDETDSYEVLKIPMKNEPDDYKDVVEIYLGNENFKSDPEDQNLAVSTSDNCSVKVKIQIEDSKKLLNNCSPNLNNLNSESYLKSNEEISTVKDETDLSSNNPLFQCDLCRNFYSSALYLKYHACPADKGDDMWELDSCKLEPIVEVKSDETATTDDRPFVCVECKKSFKTLEYLNHHLRLHYMVKPFECSQCDEAFSKFSQLKNHKSTVHGKIKERKNFKCKFCCTDCENLENLKNHILQIHPEKYRYLWPYVCPQCNKAFKSKRNLTDHKLIHTGVKPYPCEKCGKCFRTKKDVLRHRKSETACGKYLNRHLNFQALDNAVTDSGFVCNMCRKVFKRKDNLRMHLQIHSDVRPYVCKKCGKAFKQCAGLYQHRGVHRKGKTFFCNLCGKWFKLKSYLRGHRLTVHGQNGLINEKTRKM